MEQLRRLIKQTLLENYLSQVDENLEKVEPKRDFNKVEGEKIASLMMQRGRNSIATIKDGFNKMAYAIELLMYAYKQGEGVFNFPTTKQSVPINKQNIIDSVQNAFLGVTDDVLRQFLQRIGGKYWPDNVWFDTEKISGKTGIEDVKRRPLSGDISGIDDKRKFANLRGLELSDKELSEMAVPRMEYFIEKYVNEDINNTNSFFLFNIADRINKSISNLLAIRSRKERVAAKLGGPEMSPRKVSLDKPFGDKGQTFASTAAAGYEEQPEFEMPYAKKRTELEEEAITAFINKKVYEIVNSRNPFWGELFRLRVIGEDLGDDVPKTTKSNIEIANMFIAEKLSEETTKILKDYLMKKVEKAKGPQQYTPQIAEEHKSDIIKKINDTFGNIKYSILTNLSTPVKEILAKALAVSTEDAANRLEIYAALAFGEKRGEKTKKAAEKAEKKKMARKLKALVMFYETKIAKINKYKNTIETINPESFKEFFKGDTYFEKLSKVYPDFANNIMTFVSNEEKVKQVAQTLQDYEQYLKDLGDPDTLEFANVSSGGYGGVEDVENLYEESTIGSGDDNFKFDVTAFKNLAQALFTEGKINEARKTIRGILLKEFFKKQ